MKILVNNEEKHLTAIRLDEALCELGYDGKIIATAVNGDFVPRTMRAGWILNGGDSLELLAPMRGG